MSWVGSQVRKIAAGSLTVFGLWCVLGVGGAHAQAITENFDNITTLTASGWFLQNNSVPVGSLGWFQGNDEVFEAHKGAPDAYIGSNFNATTGTNTISNWMVTPNRTFTNGDVIKFWTHDPEGNPFPDRLEVRLSTNGASTNVGTGSSAVGDFTTLLLSINPSLQVGGYPEEWTEFTITLSGLNNPTSGRVAFRYFVTGGGPTGDNSNYIGIDTFSYSAGGPQNTQHYGDFDGDGKTDPAVVRNTGGGPTGQITWFIKNTAGSPAATITPWGIVGDRFVPGDYDGDNKTDLAVWRGGPPFGTFTYILKSSTSTFEAVTFGQTGDDPTVTDDYDGDGKDDVAIYRTGLASGDQSSFWYRRSSDNGIRQVLWGQNGDFPAPGDFDGDGSADFMIQRNYGGGQARFWILFANGTNTGIVMGTPTDVIVPGDYDGDGTTDIAVVRGSAGQYSWFVRPSSTGVVPGAPTHIWGASATDFFAQGDYDGDGKTDVAVWRPNADPTQCFFFIKNSSGAQSAPVEWGSNGDLPVANWNRH